MSQTRTFLSATLKLFVLTITLLILTTIMGAILSLAIVIGTLLALIGIPIFVGIVVPLIALAMQSSDNTDKMDILEQSNRSIEELKEAYTEGRISREKFEKLTSEKLKDSQSTTQKHIKIKKHKMSERNSHNQSSSQNNTMNKD